MATPAERVDIYDLKHGRMTAEEFAKRHRAKKMRVLVKYLNGTSKLTLGLLVSGFNLTGELLFDGCNGEGQLSLAAKPEDVMWVEDIPDTKPALEPDPTFPHTCPACKAPAYIGFSAIDCSKNCEQRKL